MKIGVLSMWKEIRCRFRVGVLQVMLDVDLASPVMGIAGMVMRESDIMIIYRGCLGDEERERSLHVVGVVDPDRPRWRLLR